MSSLVDLQKALKQNTLILYNVMRSLEHEKKVVFPSGLVAHGTDEVLLLSDVEGLFSEFKADYDKLQGDLAFKIRQCEQLQGIIERLNETIETQAKDYEELRKNNVIMERKRLEERVMEFQKRLDKLEQKKKEASK